VALIASTGGIGAAIAAKQATSTIPIVFTAGDDPIKHGVVASLSRPGGNVTGIYNFISAIEAKRFGLLRETVPITGTIAVLLNPNYLSFDVQLNDLQEAARAVGQQIGVFNASSEADIHTAFRAVARLPAAAVGNYAARVLKGDKPAVTPCDCDMARTRPTIHRGGYLLIRVKRTEMLRRGNACC
jgi:putative ABC transport system substrate-binding protein